MTTPPERDVSELLRNLRAQRVPGVYTFATVADSTSIPFGMDVLATIHEAEGLSLIVDTDDARAAGWPVMFEAAWITCTVHSALDAVGLTAALATALSTSGISANVVAGHHHDHLFVPVGRADDALAVLAALAQPTSSA